MRKTEFVESYFDAWNHRDSKGIADHLAAEGTYRDVPGNLQIPSDEFVIYLDDFFAVYRHRYELIGEIQKSENTIAFQYRMYLSTNKQTSAMTVTYHGAEFITLRGDAAMVITDYYDIPVKTQVNKYAKSGLTRDQLLMHKQRLDLILQLFGFRE